jgi:hypothetical protein
LQILKVEAGTSGKSSRSLFTAKSIAVFALLVSPGLLSSLYHQFIPAGMNYLF